MKKIIRRAARAIIGLSVLLVVACQPPISSNPGTDDPESAPQTLSEAANRTLANLPELKIKLPKSLSLDTSETASRVLGDTTELTLEMLPKLKSQAWFDLQSSNNSFMGFINKALGYLKAYASAHTVPVGETFNMPFGDTELAEMFNLPPELFGMFTVQVRFNIQGDSAEKFSIYGDITMTGGAAEMGTMDVHVKTRFDVEYVDADSTMDMYMQIDMTQAWDGQTYEMSMPIFASYDSKTGSCTMVSENDDGTQKSSYVESTKVAADGAISNVNASIQNGEVKYLTVAYGDDAAGGVASMNSWTYMDNGVEVSSDYYWGEYYDGNGELLRRDNGDSRLWVPVWNEGSYTNLQDLGYVAPPETYSTRSYGKSDGSVWYQYQERLTLSGNWEEISRQYSKSENEIWYSITQKKDSGVWEDAYRWYWSPSSNGYEYWDGDTWVATEYPQGDSYSFMFKANSEPGTWTAGDSVYYWKGSSSEQVGDVYYWRTDFYKGYVVPVPEARFGKEYWLSYEYPLGRVLPLSPAYSTTYKLIQEEGDTNTYNWTDWENVSHDWVWTNYSYYLNKSSRDLDGDGDTLDDTEDPIRYDEGFDIRLDKLSQYDMYYWHDNMLDKVNAYFVRTTGPLPDYFTSPSTTVINAVSDRLGALMESSFSLGLSEYQAKIESAATCTAGVF